MGNDDAAVQAATLYRRRARALRLAARIAADGGDHETARQARIAAVIADAAADAELRNRR